jgi:ubiquinone/menaquinone biosynthesis C-methylase UbiE
MEEPAARTQIQDTYDRIASHFSKTREHAWPEAEAFLADYPAGEIALDLGCGNGRNAELLADVSDTVVCLDLSRELLREARLRGRERGFDPRLVQADAASIPLERNAVDVAIYVATLHHLPTRALRVASLDSLACVLAPDGYALVSAWSTTHDTFDETEGFDTTVDWTLPGGEAVDRFYHIYDPDEFTVDLDSSDLVVEERWQSSGNCYAVVSGADD